MVGNGFLHFFPIFIVKTHSLPFPHGQFQFLPIPIHNFVTNSYSHGIPIGLFPFLSIPIPNCVINYHSHGIPNGNGNPIPMIISSRERAFNSSPRLSKNSSRPRRDPRPGVARQRHFSRPYIDLSQHSLTLWAATVWACWDVACNGTTFRSNIDVHSSV